MHDFDIARISFLVITCAGKCLTFMYEQVLQMLPESNDQISNQAQN